MLNRDAIEIGRYEGSPPEAIALVPEGMDRKVVRDALVIGAFIMGSEAVSPAIFTVLLFLYMLYKIFGSSSLYTFPYLMLLLPNLGVAFIPGVPAPLLNLLIPFAILKMVLSKRAKKLDVPLLTAMFLLLVYEFLHISLYDLGNIFTLASWVLAIVYVVMFASDDEQHYNHELAIKYFIAGIVISSVVGLYRNFVTMGTLVDFSQTNVTDRFAGAAGDPNYFSLYVLVGVFSLINLLEKQKTFLSKMLYVGYFITLPLIASMSLSRMYLIVLAFTGALYVLRVFASLNNYHTHKKAMLVVGVLGFAASFVFPVNILNNIKLVLERFTMYGGNLTLLTSNRNLIASYILNFLKENPFYMLFGVGIQGYGDRIGEGVSYAHNILLELLAASGVVGTLIFFLFVATLLYTIWEKAGSGRVKLIKALPLMAMAISYMAINAIEVESFYLLLAFSIKNLWYTGVDEV